MFCREMDRSETEYVLGKSVGTGVEQQPAYGYVLVQSCDMRTHSVRTGFSRQRPG